MTEVVAVYVAPFILVLGGALLAWRNGVVMRRAHARDRVAGGARQGDAEPRQRGGRMAAE